MKTYEQRKKQAFEAELAAARERNAKRLNMCKPWHQHEFILKVEKTWLNAQNPQV